MSREVQFKDLNPPAEPGKSKNEQQVSSQKTEQTSQSSGKLALNHAFADIMQGDIPKMQNKYNQKATSMLPVPDKYMDPLKKMRLGKGASLESEKVVKKQGKFGQVDDDECMGSSITKKQKAKNLQMKQRKMRGELSAVSKISNDPFASASSVEFPSKESNTRVSIQVEQLQKMTTNTAIAETPEPKTTEKAKDDKLLKTPQQARKSMPNHVRTQSAQQKLNGGTTSIKAADKSLAGLLTPSKGAQKRSTSQASQKGIFSRFSLFGMGGEGNDAQQNTEQNPFGGANEQIPPFPNSSSEVKDHAVGDLFEQSTDMMQKGLSSFVNFVSSHVHIEQPAQPSEDLKLKAQYTSSQKVSKKMPVQEGLHKTETLDILSPGVRENNHQPLQPAKQNKNNEPRPSALKRTVTRNRSTSNTGSRPFASNQLISSVKQNLLNKAMKEFAKELTPYEKSEMFNYDGFYCIGDRRVQGLKAVSDRDGQYRVHVGEQIGFRYLIQKPLDAGAFGQVLLCKDMKEGGQLVALKISTNKRVEIECAQREAQYLDKILQRDPDKYSIVKMTDHFFFRRHYIIVFELLEINLYKYITGHEFKGMQHDFLRRISSQILHALAHLSRLKIIHCDLKPENILFTDSTHQHVKIIDFGASCTAFKHGFTYVQSRFYRSPEVVLGLPYDSAIDMWSFGCILAELITGQPLFPAHDENHLLEYIVLTMGSLPDQMVYNSSKYKRFFDTKGKLIKSKRSKVPDDAAPGSEPLYYLLKTDKDDELTKFIAQCLIIDPAKRITAEEALRHNWVKRTNVQQMFKEGMIGNGTFMQEINDILSTPTKLDPRQSSSHETRAALEAKLKAQKKEQEEEIQFADGPNEDAQWTVQSSSSEEEDGKKPIDTNVQQKRSGPMSQMENLSKSQIANAHNRPSITSTSNKQANWYGK